MKKHTLSLYIKEIFITPSFYIAILIVTFLSYMSVRFFVDGGTISQYSLSVIDGPFANAFCVPAALPVIATFCDDCRNQYLRPIVTRSGVRQYAFAKYIAGALSAFLVTALGLIIYFSIASIYTPFTDLGLGIPPELSSAGMGPFAYFETTPFPALTFIIRSCIFATYSAVYALVGLLISAFIPNKFLALAFPYIISFMVEEICVHLFFLPSYLNFMRMQGARELFPEKGMLFNAAYDVMFPLIIAVGLYFIFRYAVEKRVRCEIG